MAGKSGEKVDEKVGDKAALKRSLFAKMKTKTLANIKLEDGQDDEDVNQAIEIENFKRFQLFKDLEHTQENKNKLLHHVDADQSK